jgi:dihydrofolate reductase
LSATRVGYWDDELGQAKGETMSDPYDLVLGRKTYEIFAAHWPDSDEPGAEELNRATQHVASTTLTELQVHGSANLIQTMLEHGLIDEFRLQIFPLVLGKGKRLFDGGTVPDGLEVTRSQVLPTGVIVASYRTGDEIKYGSFAAETPSETK